MPRPDPDDPHHVATTRYRVRTHGAVGPDVRFTPKTEIWLRVTLSPLATSARDLEATDLSRANVYKALAA